MIKRALIFSVAFFLVIIIALFFVFDSFAVRDIAKRFIVTQSYYQLGLKVNVDDVRFSYFRPAVTVTNINLEKAEGEAKIKLFAPKASVSFKLLKLLKGKIAIKGFSFESPKLNLELDYDDTKESKFDYKKYYDQLLAAKFGKINISKADIKIKVNYKSGKDSTDLSFKGLSFGIRSGVLSDYNVSLSTESLNIPIKQIRSFDISAQLKKNNLRISSLKVVADGGEISLEGPVSNIDDIKKISLALSWKSKFSLASMKDYDEYLKDKELYDFKGDFFGQGKIKYTPSKGRESLSGSASVKINNFKWFRYDIPKIELVTGYDKEKLFVSKLDVSDGIKSIFVYDTTIGLHAPYPIKGKGFVNDIELSRYLEMFGLKRCLSFFNIKGPFSFTGTAKPAIRISSMFDLSISDFWVLYKKGLLPNEENSVLSFKKGTAKGMVRFSANGAYFDKFIGQSETNEMLVNGWIYSDGKLDMDVSSSAFSLDTYGRIGTLPVKGKGSFETKLIVDDKGDFKTKGSVNFAQVEILKKYLLGNVDSAVIYDGVKLSFKDVNGRVGSSRYSGYTDVIFADKTILHGRGDFKDAYTEDVYKLFNYQKKILGSPSGFASGNVKFDGYPTWSTIKLDAKIKMRDVEFFSERFDELYASFIWDKGDIQINDLFMTKGKGRFDFKGSRKGAVFKIGVSSKNVNASDLAIISKNGVYLDGNVDLKGNLEHKNSKFNGSLKLNMLDILLNERKLKPVSLSMDVGENITVKFKLFDKEVDGELKRESDTVFLLKAKLQDFDFYPVGSMFMPDLENFKTSINGDVLFRLSTEEGVKLVTINLSSFNLTGGAFSLKSKGNVFVEYARGVYSIKPFSIISDSENVKCTMDFNTDGKKVSVKGCVSAAAFKLLKKYIASSRGRVDVDLSMGNKLNGTVYTRDLELMSAEHKLGVLNINGRINVINNIANMEHLNVSASGGIVALSGSVDMTNLINLKNVYPAAKLKANIDKLYFEYPEGLKGKWSGDLALVGNSRPYNLSGELMLYEASYRKDFELNSFKFSESSNLNFGKKMKPFFNLNVKAKSSSEIYIKNSVFVGDLMFDLNAKGSELDPKLIGSIDLIRGNIYYMDNTFLLTSGRVKFKDDEMEPYVYQLDSEIKTSSYQVFLKVLSRKGEPRFKLTSVPPLTEDKIIALLATGDTQTDFAEGQSGYGATAGAGGQIVTEGMGVTNVLKSSTGVGVKLKAPKTKDSTVPDIELQKDLTNDIRVTYGKSLDEKVSKQEVNVQYDVNRNIQLKLLLNEDKKEDAKKVPSNNAGVDVKFRFEF